MPVTDQTTSNSSTGNGVTTVFPYTFKILDEADILVEVDGVAKTLTTDYTVSGVGVSGGGNVTFGTAPASDSVVVRSRSMAYSRETDYQENGDLQAATLDEDIDRVVMLCQQLKTDGLRAIKLPVGVTTDQTITESAAERVGKLVTFDVDGNVSLVSLGESGAADASDVGFTKADGTLTNVQANSREKLTAARTYYVRTDGSNSNTGLANTAGGAFLTIQKAVDVVADTLDLNGYDVVIQVADGTYTAGATAEGPWVGNGNVYILGNTTTPSNCIINTTSADCFYASEGATFTTRGFKITTTTSGAALKAYLSGYISFQKIDFGACAASHIECGTSSTIIADGDYSISGGAVSHMHCGSPGAIVHGTITVTLTGTPAFSSYFAGVAQGSITCMTTTWTGSATGTRFLAHKGGVIDVGSGSTTTLPGNVAGYTENGGAYCDVSGNRTCVWSYNATVTDGISNQNVGSSASAQYLLQSNAGYIFMAQQSTAAGGLALLQSSPGTGMLIGTTTAKYLAILTNNISALIVGSDQNIGIGRTPAARSAGGNLEVNGNLSTGTPVVLTGITTRTVGDSESSFIIACSASLTLTLPDAATYPGRWIYLLNQAAYTVVSASSNVVALAGGAAGTAILAAAAGKFAWLQSNGTSWSIMAAN